MSEMTCVWVSLFHLATLVLSAIIAHVFTLITRRDRRTLTLLTANVGRCTVVSVGTRVRIFNGRCYVERTADDALRGC